MSYLDPDRRPRISRRNGLALPADSAGTRAVRPGHNAAQVVAVALLHCALAAPADAAHPSEVNVKVSNAALAIMSPPLLLAAATGDDDDIDDLIIERARKRAADRARTNRSGGTKETEDDLYVGGKPAADRTNPGVKPAPPAAAPSGLKKVNCGTFWTGWYAPIDPKTNPCPAGCEPGEKLSERRHQQGPTTLIDAQYQCYGVAAARSAGLDSKPVREARLPGNAIGTLTPEAGKWNSFVTLKGPGFAKAERVAVIWYPNDDDAQPQAGSISATLRKRAGTDEIQIEMPRDAGGSSGGTVRVYVFMPAQLQPVLAGRFTVNNQLGAVPAGQDAAAEPPIALTTSPLKMVGQRLDTLATRPNRLLSEPTIAMTAPPLRMTGQRLATVAASPQRQLAEAPIAWTTSALRMTGQRLAQRTIDQPARLVEPVIAFATPPLRMTGQRSTLPNAPVTPTAPIDLPLRTRP